MRERVLNAMWALLVLVTASCLQGDGTPGRFPSSGEPTIGGSAAKGVLWRGNVRAEELDADGTPLRLLGSAVTDREGRYSLALNRDYRGGPIRMELSAGAETLMRCDAPVYGSVTCGRHAGEHDLNGNGLIDRGEWFLPGEFSMSALLPRAAPGERISISITPFTHLAAALAQESGALNAESVNSANHGIGYLLGGLNITHTPVIDVMDDTAVASANLASLYYSALTAGTIALAGVEPSIGRPNLPGMLERLTTSIRGGRLPALPGISPGATTLSELLRAGERQLDSLGRTDLSGMMSRAYALAAAPVDGYVYLPPDLAPPVDGVGRIKDLVRAMRLWGNVIAADGESATTFLERKALISQRVIERAAGELSTVLSAAVIAIAESDFQNTDLGALRLPRLTEAQGTISADRTQARVVLTGVLTPWSNKQPYEVSLDVLFKSLSEAEITGNIKGPSETLEITRGNIYFSLSSTAGGVRTLDDGALHLEVVLHHSALLDRAPVELLYRGKFASTLRALQTEGEVPRSFLPTSMKLDGRFSQAGGLEFDAVLAADLNGIDPATVTDEDYLSGDLIASATIEEQLEGRPPAWFTLHGSLQDLSTRQRSLTISHDGCPLNIEVVPQSKRKYSLNLSDCSGATLSVLMPDGTGEATYNDKLYGAITKIRNTLKVDYADGTFETIL